MFLLRSGLLSANPRACLSLTVPLAVRKPPDGAFGRGDGRVPPETQRTVSAITPPPPRTHPPDPCRWPSPFSLPEPELRGARLLSHRNPPPRISLPAPGTVKLSFPFSKKQQTPVPRCANPSLIVALTRVTQHSRTLKLCPSLLLDRGRIRELTSCHLIVVIYIYISPTSGRFENLHFWSAALETGLQ